MKNLALTCTLMLTCLTISACGIIGTTVSVTKSIVTAPIDLLTMEDTEASESETALGFTE